MYKIIPSRYSDIFTIDPNTGMLRNKVELDREAIDPTLKGKIELNITATDKGVPALSSMVTVTINVQVSIEQSLLNYWVKASLARLIAALFPHDVTQDVNDNAPKFNASSYKFYVKEGEKGNHLTS